MTDNDRSSNTPSSEGFPAWEVGTRLPRVSVRALVVDGDDILAVENLAARGKLHMPGGGVHHGETLRAALLRELGEELCIGAATIDYQLAIENLFETHLGLMHCVEHVFLVTPEGEPRPGEAELLLHRLPIAQINTVSFYPLSLRDLLIRPDWRDCRYLKAGEFVGEN